MSRIPSVFTRSKTINHFLCDNRAAFHRATPFHGIDHRVMSTIIHAGKPFNKVVSIAKSYQKFDRMQLCPVVEVGIARSTLREY